MEKACWHTALSCVAPSLDVATILRPHSASIGERRCRRTRLAGMFKPTPLSGEPTPHGRPLDSFLNDRYSHISPNDRSIRAAIRDFIVAHPIASPPLSTGKLYDEALLLIPQAFSKPSVYCLRSRKERSRSGLRGGSIKPVRIAPPLPRTVCHHYESSV